LACRVQRLLSAVLVLLAHCHLSFSSALKETLHLEVVDSEASTMKTVLGCVLLLVCVDDARAVDHRKYIDVYPRPYNHLVCDKHIPNWVMEELGSDTDRPSDTDRAQDARHVAPAPSTESRGAQSATGGHRNARYPNTGRRLRQQRHSCRPVRLQRKR
jgi:hypothetical protein